MSLKKILASDCIGDLSKEAAEKETPETNLCYHSEYCTLRKINGVNCTTTFGECFTYRYYKENGKIL